MRFALLTALKDLKRRLADPMALAVWAGIPLLVGTLITLMGGAGAPALRPHVLVVDLDDSFLSNLVSNAGGELLQTEKVDLDEGRARMNEGDATALLVIPEGFQDGVLYERPTRLELITNPAERILPRVVEEALDIMLEAAFYLQRLMGEPLQEIADSESFPTNAQVGNISVQINERLSAIQDVALPPVIQVDYEVEREEDGSSSGFGLLFFPGFLFMSVIFVAQGMSEDVWKEKEQGTLRRFISSPRSAVLFLGGKLLAGTALMAFIASLGVGVGVLFFELSPAALPLAVGWCALAGTGMYTLFLLIQLFASTPRAGSLLTMMVLFPLIMLGGSFFPFEMMPGWMRDVGSWTPNGQALVQLKHILAGDLEPAALARAAAFLAGSGAVLFSLSLRRLRGRFLGAG